MSDGMSEDRKIGCDEQTARIATLEASIAEAHWAIRECVKRPANHD